LISEGSIGSAPRILQGRGGRKWEVGSGKWEGGGTGSTDIGYQEFFHCCVEIKWEIVKF